MEGGKAEGEGVKAAVPFRLPAFVITTFQRSVLGLLPSCLPAFLPS